MDGGGVTSCSNGSDDPEATPNPDVPEGWTEINVGDIEKYNGQDGTTAYSVTKNGDGSITISHDGTMGKYASCSFKPNFGENNTLYTKITNNSEVEATVQVQVNKAGTEANKYQPDPTVISVYVDGEKRSDASEYSVELKIAANASVVIANKFDIEKNPDTVAISLNSQESVAGTVEKGNITVSGISMKKITDEDESELETSTDDNNENTGPEQNEEEETPPPATDDDNNQTGGEGEGTTPPITDNDNNQTDGEGEGTTPPTTTGKTAIKFNGFDGWGKYTIDEDKDATVTLSHKDAVETNDCCGMDISIGDNNAVECKVKNNSPSEIAYVKISIKNDQWSTTNNYKSGLLSATIDEKPVDSVDYGALATIKANETATFVLKLNTTIDKADKFVVSFNSENTTNMEEVESMPTSGNITISDAYMWKE